MKLTKARLKQIIKEEIEGQAAPAPRGKRKRTCSETREAKKVC